MSDLQGFGLNGPLGSGRRTEAAMQSHPRPITSPLPIGRSGSASALEPPSTLQRAVKAVRATLPFVQRLLPLLDGNIGTAVSNILSPHPRMPQPPPPPVSLLPIEDELAELQSQHRDLCAQFVEQNSSLKRVEEQLVLVREASDRNALEQKELIEDLKGVGNKINWFAFFAFALLAISVVLNLILYFHIKRVLP